ncbi:glycine radical enzyme activase, YjjW family [Shewanella psychrophila]|uniref:Glycine radical enzyme activase, YjjW family n=1 Tax=Shewanella psychrophila TaxID=225848 RepID=A0A1S6HJ42_9GAMM|nr:YjjW family glycine radical enzyme activase [Shewanella psychrophila]AQS35542.1 glycine radical enzyme activase, YjjW family [Shewanella psychrophila]
MLRVLEQAYSDAAHQRRNERSATVTKILSFSCVDGPGNRLVIFLQGCNFNCKSCHNPHTIGLCDNCGLCLSSCPVQALSLIETDGAGAINWDTDLCIECDACLEACPKQASPKTCQYTVSQLLAVIRKNSPFITGITVSGGEASLQLMFIVGLFSAIKSSPELQHLNCMLDTNGSLSESGWHKLLPYMDGAMVDLKAWQKETHLWLTGRDNHRVFRSMELLASEEKLYEVRLLHIPGKSDLDSEISAIAEYLKRLPSSTKIRLNAFGHHGVKGEALAWQTCSEEDMTTLAERLTERGVISLTLPSVYL